MMNTSANKKDLVLIVDDSPENLSMLNQALEREGMETLVAFEGSQALSIARKMLPDIILLDAMMPNMDGFEVCRQIRRDENLSNMPVLMGGSAHCARSDHPHRRTHGGSPRLLCPPAHLRSLPHRPRDRCRRQFSPRADLDDRRLRDLPAIT